MTIEPRHAIVAAPMSFTGAAQRAWKLAGKPHGTGWNVAARSAAYVGVLLLIAVWWAVVACWYVVFSFWLIPYRIMRRGQRQAKAAGQRVPLTTNQHILHLLLTVLTLGLWIPVWIARAAAGNPAGPTIRSQP